MTPGHPGRKRRPAAASPAPRASGPERPGLRWGAAAAVLVLIAAWWLTPIYRPRIATGFDQISVLHRRVGIDLEQMRRGIHKGSYAALELVRDNTFPGAVILISDDPRDEPLNSILWCSYYLYPRVLYQKEHLAADSTLRPDFVMMTPYFPPDLPDSLRRHGVSAASPRGQEYMSRRENR
jgi:hypothetical protein